jgi:hypothetical protein
MNTLSSAQPICLTLTHCVEENGPTTANVSDGNKSTSDVFRPARHEAM